MNFQNQSVLTLDSSRSPIESEEGGRTELSEPVLTKSFFIAGHDMAATSYSTAVICKFLVSTD